MPTLAEMLGMAQKPLSESQDPNLQMLIAAAMAARKKAREAEQERPIYSPMIGVRG